MSEQVMVIDQAQTASGAGPLPGLYDAHIEDRGTGEIVATFSDLTMGQVRDIAVRRMVRVETSGGMPLLMPLLP